jgi:hypothetical protein
VSIEPYGRPGGNPRLDLSLSARYHTVWPALSTRIAWHLSGQTIRACTFGRSRWLRATTAALLALVPVALIFAAWLVCAALFVLWPLGWLMMLPTRIAVGRNVTQQTMIYVLCWVSLLPFIGFVTWVSALVLAFRDPRPITAH